MLRARDFFDLSDCGFVELFSNDAPVWSALADLKDYIAAQAGQLPGILGDGVPLSRHVALHQGTVYEGPELEIRHGDATRGRLVACLQGRVLEGATVVMAGAVLCGRTINLGPGVLVEAGAYIREPAIIGAASEVRQGAYLRGNCLVGRRCVVGHATEMKHSIMLDDAKAGHFAYVGDSILGRESNLGAGTKLANLKFLRGEVRVRTPEGMVATGLSKLGAILGDRAQTGCNSVTNPGTLIGPEGMLLPNVTAPSGWHPARCLLR
ncbi:MAG: bifunctional GlmU protein [Desulfobulbaceae bacterium A2]|nr:MAG: bifunctional GlmU protein [Desulfobulbaceae bacterium A2]